MPRISLFRLQLDRTDFLDITGPFKKPKNDQNESFLRNCNFLTKDSWFDTSSLTETKLYFESNCISSQNYATKNEIFHILVKMVLLKKNQYVY